MKMLRILFFLMLSSSLAWGQQGLDTTAKKVKEKSAVVPIPTFDSGADSHVKIQDAKAQVLNAEQYQAYQNFLADYDQYLQTGNYQIDESERQKLQEEVKKVTASNLTTKEVFLANYLLSDFDKSSYSLLETAYNYDPADTRILGEMVRYHVVYDEPNSPRYLKELNKVGYFSTSELNFAKNQLNSLPPNAQMISNAKTDSYALWYAQKVWGVRGDVEVISLELISHQQYRKNLQQKSSSKIFNMNNYKGNASQWILSTASSNAYVSLSVRKDILNLLEHSLQENQDGSSSKKHFQSGLCYHLNSYGWNINQELMMYTKMDLSHLKNGKAEAIDRNYLPFLYRLYQHYKETSNKSKQDEIKDLMLKIARDQGIEKRIKALL